MLNKDNIRAVGFLILGSLVLFGFYVSWHSSFHTCVSEAANTYTAEHQNAENQAVPVPFLHGYASCANRIARHDGDAITALATAMLTAITLALVFLGMEQSKTTRGQMRAYVLHSTTSLYDGSTFPTTVGVNRIGQPGGVTDIKNFGQTPAYNVRHWSDISVGPVTDEYRMSAPTDISWVAPAVLGPSHPITAYRWLNRPLSPQEVQGINTGTHAVYVFGRVEYLDAFKERHWATYRLRYTTSLWPPFGGNASMNFCAEGNDAD